MDFLQSSFRNLQGVAKLSSETADLLIDLRQDAELSILKQIQLAVGEDKPGAQFVARGIELTTLVVNRQHSLERDLLARLNEFIVGAQASAELPGKHKRTQSSNESHFTTGETVHVATHAGDGPVVMPLKLRNHHDTPQTVTLHAVKLEGEEGIMLPLHQIHFHPAKLVLQALRTTTAYVVIEVDPKTHAGADYWTEIRIGGSDPRRFPLCLTLLPPRQTEEAVSSGLLSVADDVEHGT